MTDRKKATVTAFLVFLGFMAVCTVIAKGIYTSGLPRASTVKPERKNISHTVEMSGTVRQGQEYGVYTEQGLRVATVPVHTGETVERGTLLFQIDVPDLEKVIKEKEFTLEKLAARQKETASTQELEKRKQELAVARSGQDYEQALRNANLTLERKREELRKAEKEREEYRKASGSGAQVSGGDASAGQSGGDGLTALDRAVTEAAQAVEDAILAREDALAAANRTIEDAKLAMEKPFSAEEITNKTELLQEQESLERLRKLLADQGKICAAEPGKITEVPLRTGDRTPDGACVLYALDDGERLLEVPLTREQEKYVEPGDEVQLSYRSASGASGGGKGRISYLLSAGDQTVARIELGDAEVMFGQPVSVSLSKASDPFECCVPTEAVISDPMGGYYVYIPEAQEGIMGTEWRVAKVSVKVLDKNETYAAIEGSGITDESLIIQSCNKEIGEGTAVRLLP